MKNDPISNIAMARVYRTAVAVSALILSSSFAHAADPPVGRGNVSVNLNPTTGYYVTNNTTLRLPDGVRATPAAGASTVAKYSGGLKQTLPTGITIDAIKKSAPLPVAVRASTPSLKTAAKGLFKGGIAGIVLGAGLQQLLDGVDWVMGDGGTIQRKEVADAPANPDVIFNSEGSLICKNGTAAAVQSCVESWADNNSESGFSWFASGWSFNRSDNYIVMTIKRSGNSNANWLYANWVALGALAPVTTLHPVSDSEIDNTVDSFYVPEPSDWTALTPKLGLDDIEITSSPTLQGEPKTTTIYDADGNPHKIVETNIWYDFDVRDNLSPKPKLDLKKREETKTYEDGVLTGTTTTQSTDSAGSDDTPPPPPESPIDCDLFPTACAWFDWTKEEPVEPDDDLSGLLREVPIVNETYTITGGVAACPAPLVLDLSVFGSREVSYQPLCDLASTMKFLYLALMSFAAAVLLHRSINRV